MEGRGSRAKGVSVITDCICQWKLWHPACVLQESPQGDVNATKVRTSSLKDRNRGRRSPAEDRAQQTVGRRQLPLYDLMSRGLLLSVDLCLCVLQHNMLGPHEVVACD